MEFRPLRARERPLVLGAFDEALAGMANLQHHLRLAVPAVLLALQEIAEALLPHLHAVVGVEVSPLRVAVHLAPLLFAPRVEVPIDAAACLQPPATRPAARNERT